MNRSQFNKTQTETVNSARLFVWSMVILLTAVFLSGCTTLSHAAEYYPNQNRFNQNESGQSFERDRLNYSQDSLVPSYSNSRRHQRFRPVSDENRFDDYEYKLKQLLSEEAQSYERPRNRDNSFSRDRIDPSQKRQSRDYFDDNIDSQKLRELIRDLQQRSMPQYDRDRYETEFPTQYPVDPHQELRNKISQRYSSPSVIGTLQNLDPKERTRFTWR